MAEPGTLHGSLRHAAGQALTALADEIDHYASPVEVPFETRLAHDALADALDAFTDPEEDDSDD